jgi:peptide/nickel transport system substrate-binding protein
MRGLGLGALLLATGLTAQPAQAQKSADTLRVTWNESLPNIIPYFNQQRAGMVLSTQVWDGLVYRDPDTFAIKPLLATSWKYTDPTTLEFKLRQGVKFQDGSPFTADDVVYTFNTVIRDKAVSSPGNYRWMEGATKIDDYTVQVKLKNIFPAAIEYLALVMPIMPKAYTEKVGLDGYNQRPIAAGPYQITKVDGVAYFDLERWDGYYADSPKGRPAIKKIRIHEVTDATTMVNELLGNRADWIWKYNIDLLPKIAAMPNLSAVQADSMRILRLQFDAAGRSGADNPLTKQKVRQAISYAIDRKTFAKQLVGGDSRVLDAYCYPTQFGCDTSQATKYHYDPAMAKKLLAEAGYPNGFNTEIVSYVLPQWEGAVQSYLKAVGINAKITHLTVPATIKRNLEGTSPINFGSWGSYSVNDVSAILPDVFSFTTSDYARNPEVKKLLDEGGASVDPDTRRKYYIEAIAITTKEAYVLPLATQTVPYAMTKDLNFKPYPDELPRFYLSSWK